MTLVVGQRGDGEGRLRLKLKRVTLNVTGDTGSISSAVTVKTREGRDQRNLVSD